MRTTFVRAIVAALVATASILLSASGATGPAVAAAAARRGDQGLQGGWAVDDAGQVNFVHAASLQYNYMQQAGAGWVRVNFRLGACFPDWTSTQTCLHDGTTALDTYDLVIRHALEHRLNVLGLLSNETLPNGQADWLAGNAERAGGNGHNAYADAFAERAGLLARHFAGQIGEWEVWNEPNAWTRDPVTNYDPAHGLLPGGSFLFPSNFAWLLKLSYQSIKAAQPRAVVVAGGLFAHEPMGVTSTVMVEGAPVQVVKRSTYRGPGSPSDPAVPNVSTSGSVANAPDACTSRVPVGADSGASYLCALYRMGRATAGWTDGNSPLDHVGQHLYLDQGGLTSAAKLSLYLDDLRSAYVVFEGRATRKQTQITEVGWQQPSVGLEVQAQNLRITYGTFRRLGYVGRGYWFTAQDIGEAGLLYGLVDSDGQRKPAFGAYQNAAF